MPHEALGLCKKHGGVQPPEHSLKRKLLPSTPSFTSLRQEWGYGPEGGSLDLGNEDRP